MKAEFGNVISLEQNPQVISELVSTAIQFQRSSFAVWNPRTHWNDTSPVVHLRMRGEPETPHPFDTKAYAYDRRIGVVVNEMHYDEPNLLILENRYIWDQSGPHRYHEWEHAIPPGIVIPDPYQELVLLRGRIYGRTRESFSNSYEYSVIFNTMLPKIMLGEQLKLDVAIEGSRRYGRNTAETERLLKERQPTLNNLERMLRIEFTKQRNRRTHLPVPNEVLLHTIERLHWLEHNATEPNGWSDAFSFTLEHVPPPPPTKWETLVHTAAASGPVETILGEIVEE
jgi:hypothetical protein